MICAVSSNLVAGHERVRRGGASSGWPSAGARASRPRSRRPSNSRSERPVGLNLHTHLEGWVRPGHGGGPRRADGRARRPPAGWDAALRMREPGRPDGLPRPRGRRLPGPGLGRVLRRVAREAVEDAAADGCDYLEIRFGPSTHATTRVRPRGRHRRDLRGPRRGPPRDRPPGRPRRLCCCATTTRRRTLRSLAPPPRPPGAGVVGLDVAGDELVYPSIAPVPRVLRDRRGRRSGVDRTRRRGGSGRARDRRGRAARRDAGSDMARTSPTIPTVLAWAADHGVTFEVCPTSNVLTGAARSDRRASAPRLPGGRLPGRRWATTIRSRSGRTLAAEERRLVTDGGLSDRAGRRASTAPRARSSFTDDVDARRSLREVRVRLAGVAGRAAATRSPCSGPSRPTARRSPAIAAASQFTTPSCSQRQRAPRRDGLVGVWHAQLGAAEDVDDVERARAPRPPPRACRNAGIPRTSVSFGFTGTHSKPCSSRYRNTPCDGRPASDEAPMTAIRRVDRRTTSMPASSRSRDRAASLSQVEERARPGHRRRIRAARQVRAFLDVRLPDGGRGDAPADDAGEHDDGEEVRQRAEGVVVEARVGGLDARQADAQVARLAGWTGWRCRAPPRT